MAQESLDTFHETFRKINERLAALEVVHTRYGGPPGKKGESQPPKRNCPNADHLKLALETNLERCPIAKDS